MTLSTKKKEGRGSKIANERSIVGGEEGIMPLKGWVVARGGRHRSGKKDASGKTGREPSVQRWGGSPQKSPNSRGWGGNT